MNALKRWISMILAVAMITSLVVLPASAEDALTVTADAVAAKSGATDATTNISIANNPGVTAMDVYVYYKSNILTCTKAVSGSVWNAFMMSQMSTGTVPLFAGNADNQDNCSPEESTAGWKMASFSYATQYAFSDYGVIGTLTFTVAADAESCDTALRVVVVSCTAEGNKDITSAVVTGNGKLTVDGVTPTLTSVAVMEGETTIADNEHPGTVHVDNTEHKTYTLKAASAKGTDLTGLVNWEVISAGDEGYVYFEDGKLCVHKKAPAGEYTIKATPKEGVTGDPVTAKLTVVRDCRAKLITFVAKDSGGIPSGNSGSITIPGTGVEAEEWTLTAAVLDQFGTGMNDLQVTFSYDKNPGDVSGITVNTSANNTLELTVSSDAAKDITSSQNFTITASYTDGDKIISNTFTLTIQRAESEVKSIEINGDATIAVPTKAVAQKEIPYTATVQDQYGSFTGNQVTWGLKEAPDGVEIDQTGKVTVKTEAVKSQDFFNDELTFTVTATCGKVTGEKAVKLTRDDSEVTYMEITGADTLEILTDENNTAQYTANGKDKYDQPMGVVPSKDVKWSINPVVSGVSINESTGELTVTKDAAEKITDILGQKFTITARYSDTVFKEKTIFVKRAESVATSMTVAQTCAAQGPFVVPGRDAGGVYIDFTATVRDQYGSEMKNQNVTWSILKDNAPLKNDNDVMSIFDGRALVAPGAKTLVLTTEPVTFTVKAELGELSDTADFQLKRADSVLDSFNLYKREGTSGEFTLVSQDMIVVPSDSTIKTIHYMAKPVDQYGAEMSTDVAYTLKLTRTAGETSTVLDALEFDAATKIGTLTVTKTSPTAQTETLEIGIHAKNSANEEVNTFYNVTFSHKDVANVTVADTLALTYGDERGITATVEGTGTNAKWTWTSSDTSVVTASGSTTAATLHAHKAGSATITVTYEDDSRYGTATLQVTVEPKTLTVGAGTAHVTKPYSGTTGATALQGTLDIQGLVGDDRPVLWSVGAYPDKNVGSGTMEVTLRLDGTGKDNYRLTSDKVTVPYTITPAQLSLGTIQAVDRAYIAGDKTVSANVTFDGLVNNETLAPGTDYTVTAEMADPNAGSGKKVSVTVVLEGGPVSRNYTFASGNTASRDTTVTISKVAYTGTTTASTSARYGNTATLDLSTLDLPEGYSLAQGTVKDDDGILAGAEVAGYYLISDNTLKVPLKNDASKANKTATITIPVTSTNYENFDLVITVTVNDKLENTMKVSDMTLYYGESKDIVVTDAVGKVEIESQIGGGITVMGNTVYATNVGTTTVTVKAAGNDEYAAAEKTITIKILPKPITLKIDDKSAYVGDTLPTLSYTIVPGLVGADTLTVEPVLYVDAAEGVDPMKQVGTYTIKTSKTPSAGDNYSLTVVEGTLSVTNRPSAITPVGPSAGTVRVDETEGGTVRVTPGNASEGSTVTIVVTPDQGQELKSLEVLDKDGDALEITDLGGGRYSFEMPSGKVTVKAEFGKAGLPYNDVKEGDWFYSAVEYVTEAGLMGDTGHGSFEPNTNTTRAMIWAILARLSGVDTTPVSGPWYAVAQEWAMNSGVSDGTNPNGAITREQLVTMLYRYAESHGIDVTEGGMAIREFADFESVSSFAVPAMEWAVNTGLISGIDGKLVPQGLATRSQVATVLMRFAQLTK